MNYLSHTCLVFWQDESGLSSVEYIVAGTLVIVLLVAGFATLGTTIQGKLSFLNTEVG